MSKIVKVSRNIWSSGSGKAGNSGGDRNSGDVVVLLYTWGDVVKGESS